MSTEVTKVTKSNTIASVRTSGSLAEQGDNAIQKIVSARMSRGGGYEVTAVGGIEIRSWSPATQAAIEIVRRAIEASIDSGNDAVIENTTEQLGKDAKLTRAAVRQHVVEPLVGQAELRVKELLMRGVAGITCDNAAAACEQIIHRAYDVIGAFDESVKSQVDMLLSEERVLGGIGDAIRSSTAGVGTMVSALGRAERDAQQEPERIAHDLRESAEAATNSEQRLKVVAIEAGRTMFFGKSHAAGRVVREVHVTLPTLTAERLAQTYLPRLREGLPAVVAACRHHRERLTEILGQLRRDRERVLALAARAEAELSERGRSYVVGAPRSEVARRAEIDKLVDAVSPATEAELRATILNAPMATVLEKMLAIATGAVRGQAASPSVDQIVLADRDPAEVAISLDGELQGIEVPVALQPGADHARLREWRSRVLCTAPGSRLATALVEHAGYSADSFNTSASADTFEALVVQQGVSIEDTRVFHDGAAAYHAETTDPATAPVQAMSDKTLAVLANRQRER